MIRFFLSITLALFPLAAHADPPTWFTSSTFQGDILANNLAGLNAFVNEPEFGGIRDQFLEVRDTLGIKHVRILFAWNDQMQPTPNSSINFSFYDQIAANIPSGMNAIAVLTGLPSWMSDSKNWIKGNPRKTFVEKWVKPVANRFGHKKRIIGWEIWNEPNSGGNPDNTTLGIEDSPTKYVKMLATARKAILKAPGKDKLVIATATTAITQDYPETLNYNQDMKAAGLEKRADIINIHYYGTDYATLLLGGVTEYLNSLTKDIWLTESGDQGINNQLSYVEEVWPVLYEAVPGIKRYYYYQFTESTPADETYGLRNLTPGLGYSDLYLWLAQNN